MTTEIPSEVSVDTSEWKKKNCHDCDHCKLLKSGSLVRAFLGAKGMKVPAISPSGKIYNIPGMKLKDKQFATCSKGYWPKKAVANPQQMRNSVSEANREKSNWFYTFAADCADFADAT
jgi:hypothetical protein